MTTTYTTSKDLKLNLTKGQLTKIGVLVKNEFLKTHKQEELTKVNQVEDLPGIGKNYCRVFQYPDEFKPEIENVIRQFLEDEEIALAHMTKAVESENKAAEAKLAATPKQPQPVKRKRTRIKTATKISVPLSEREIKQKMQSLKG